MTPAVTHASDTITQITIDVIIPALNEEASLPHTLERLTQQTQQLPEISDVHITWRAILVVNNGSEDQTAQVARACGARR